MNDLVEKIAKALWHDRWEGYGRSWELESDKEQDDYRAAARAVLAAIEESGTHVVMPADPTDMMRYRFNVSVYGAVPSGAAIDADGMVRIGYAAMLSARPPITGEHE